MLNVSDIYERLKAATPGPWTYESKGYDCTISAENGDPMLKYVSWDDFITVYGSVDNPSTGRAVAAANARFIAHARDDVADLIIEVRRLANENRHLRAEVIDLQSRSTSITNAIERERAAVVAYLRACDGESDDFADDIESGVHISQEKP
jgi:hypothetical protein